MLFASLCLGLLYRRHIGHIERPALFSGAITGLCLATGYQFQTAGLRLTTPSKSAFITGLVVVIVPLILIIPAPRRHARTALERLPRSPPRLRRHSPAH